MSRMEEIIARLAKATDGPWTSMGYNVYLSKLLGGFSLRDCPNAIENVAFIANSPSDIQFLLEEVERVQSKLSVKMQLVAGFKAGRLSEMELFHALGMGDE